MYLKSLNPNSYFANSDFDFLAGGGVDMPRFSPLNPTDGMGSSFVSVVSFSSVLTSLLSWKVYTNFKIRSKKKDKELLYIKSVWSKLPVVHELYFLHCLSLLYFPGLCYNKVLIILQLACLVPSPER